MLTIELYSTIEPTNEFTLEITQQIPIINILFNTQIIISTNIVIYQQTNIYIHNQNIFISHLLTITTESTSSIFILTNLINTQYYGIINFYYSQLQNLFLINNIIDNVVIT